MELIPVIGLEMHAEINSTTKVFSPAENTFNDISNLHVNNLYMKLNNKTENPTQVKEADAHSLHENKRVALLLFFQRWQRYDRKTQEPKNLEIFTPIFFPSFVKLHTYFRSV